MKGLLLWLHYNFTLIIPIDINSAPPFFTAKRAQVFIHFEFLQKIKDYLLVKLKDRGTKKQVCKKYGMNYHMLQQSNFLSLSKGWKLGLKDTWYAHIYIMSWKKYISRKKQHNVRWCMKGFKMWSLHTVKYYSGLEGSNPVTCYNGMNLEILCYEISQSQKTNTLHFTMRWFITVYTETKREQMSVVWREGKIGNCDWGVIFLFRY